MIRERETGREYSVRAQYVIGADGGRTVPGLVGIDYEGLGVLGRAATIHATADFSQLLGDEDVLLRWCLSPQAGTRRGDGADGTRALGHAVGGVGDPPQLPARRSPGGVRRGGRERHPRRDGHRRSPDADPHDHALDPRRRPGVEVPCRARPARGRRRAPPPADRGARPDQRDPRRAQPLLEARRRHLPARPPMPCWTPTRPSAAPSTRATSSAPWKTPSTTCRSRRRSSSALTAASTRTGRDCSGCGAGAPRTSSCAARCCA